MATEFLTIYLTREKLTIPPPVFSTVDGAVIDFCGVVREKEGEHSIAGLDYESYDEMAEIKLRQICSETQKKFRLGKVHLIHRVGFVEIGDTSLFLRVASGHREEAFAGSREIIERLKMEVPIWKNPINARQS